MARIDGKAVVRCGVSCTGWDVRGWVMTDVCGVEMRIGDHGGEKSSRSSSLSFPESESDVLDADSDEFDIANGAFAGCTIGERQGGKGTGCTSGLSTMRDFTGSE